jgi:hypothetical protein
MPMMLARISADTGPRAWIEERQSPGSARWIMATSDNRQFAVPQPVFQALRKANVVPPPAGQTYDINELDRQLFGAGLTLQERLQVKVALGQVGLLPGA